MSAKKKSATRSKTAEPRAHASKTPRIRNVHVELHGWTHGMTVKDAYTLGDNVDAYIESQLARLLPIGDLFHEWEGEPREMPDMRRGPFFTLRLCLREKFCREFERLASAHGFTLAQGLAQALAGLAARELPSTEGEDWKRA